MIAVTGAGGFLGERLCQELEGQGYPVLKIRRGDVFNVDGSTVFMDITRSAHADSLSALGLHVDVFIHLAGRIHIDLNGNPEGPELPPVTSMPVDVGTYMSNVVGTANMLNAAYSLGCNHFIFASSQAVYGMPLHRPLKEESSTNPLEHYAVSKLGGEEVLRAAASSELSVSILRFPGLYHESRAEGSVFKFCKSAKGSGEIHVDPKFPVPYDVLYLDDVVEAFVCACQAKPERFRILNISGPSDISV